MIGNGLQSLIIMDFYLRLQVGLYLLNTDAEQ